MIRPHRERAWRNDPIPEPLPENPDSFPWRAGEVVFGNPPARLPGDWTPILADIKRRDDDKAEAVHGQA